MLRIIALMMCACGVMISSCKSPTEAIEVCGISTEWESFGTTWIPSEEGTMRIVHLIVDKDEPEDICTEEHVTPRYVVLTDVNVGIKPEDIELFAVAQIPLKAQRSAKMEQIVEGKFEAFIEMGLAQVYPKKPGYFSMQFLAKFPKRGDWPTDSTYLATYIQAAQVKLEYRKYKAP